MSRIRDETIKSVVEYFADMTDEAWDRMEEKTESPIETAFLVAFYSICLIYEERFVMCDGLFTSDAAFERDKRTIAVTPQCQVEKYRADFLIEIDLLGKREQVIVECDGHNFHEKTKEQAARDKSRDRALHALGFKVFRFTGSEIYRNARDCAHEIFEHLDGRRHDIWMESRK
ncbi:MAG: DUF559 domain-containing protein [Hyphomicrobiales bacterium]|nr:DUF559 domain-containing protein [Hyphomicrobiales bacterium]